MSWFPLAAVLKTWLSDWTGFTTAQSIQLWLLKLLPDLQWSNWLVLLYLLCSPAKRCPGLTSAILLFSSRLPFPTVWTLTSALLIPVLSINVTPLINSASGSLSSILLWQNPDKCATEYTHAHTHTHTKWKRGVGWEGARYLKRRAPDQVAVNRAVFDKVKRVLVYMTIDEDISRRP